MPDTPALRGRRRAPAALIVTALVVLATIVLLVWWVLGRSQATPWGKVEAEGRHVVVHYVGGECDRSASLHVEEGPREVVLTVEVVGWALSCSDVGVPRTLRATLDEPLGDREVVDGACRRSENATHLACANR
ncbi:hypothetical protein IEQ44_00595 [Nocardioides sp. Y6]|uniref:DUF4307 domain-containing protein n=1 Tax=Nocardioides malaquae TaxID=2773426 RepID=A0ABR9RNR2_9ACTN|nr:hypothetical protein [Nocardioides malaquae]MBE7323148.1 hypothetical protein [Nocardioides malaquae]